MCDWATGSRQPWKKHLPLEVRCKNGHDTSHPSRYTPVKGDVGAPPTRRGIFLSLLNLGLAMCLALARGALVSLCSVTCPLAALGNLHSPSCGQRPVAGRMTKPMTQARSLLLLMLSHLPDT